MGLRLKMRPTWFARLLLLTLLFQTSIHALRPMVSYRALEIGAGPAELGIVTSAFAVLALVVGVPIGRVVDRFGEAPFMIAGTTLVAIIAASLTWIDSLVLLVGSQAILGFAYTLNLVAMQALIANAGTSQRDRQFGRFTVAASMGQLVGPAVAGLVAAQALPSNGLDTGTNLAFGVAAGVALASTVAALSLSLHPAPRHVPVGEPPSRVPLRALWRVAGMPQALLASLSVLTSVDIVVAYLPAYGVETGLPVEVVGLLLATRAAASMTSRLAIVPLTSRFGRRRLLVGSMGVAAAALLLIPWLTSVPALAILMACVGLGLGLGQPLTLVWVAAHAPIQSQGTALALRLSGNRIGQLVVPAAVGSIAGVAGLGSIFLAIAGLLGVACILVQGAAFSESTTRRPAE